MKQRIFNIKGRVIDSDNKPRWNIYVTVVDKDFLLDDLLGMGYTDLDGKFRLSFTEHEFNLNLFENQEYPDLQIVLSFYNKEKKAICGIKKIGYKFPKSDTFDIGDIILEDLKEDKKINPFPGIKNKVAKLNIDDDLAQNCLEELVPIIKMLTGWDIEDDLFFYIYDGYNDDEEYSQLLNKYFETNLSEMGPFSKLILAQYFPFNMTMYINRNNLKYANLDRFKVSLGHELVHYCQFKYHPELLDEYINNFKLFMEELKTTDLMKAIRTMNPVMTNIEGYASYIQKKLSYTYNLAYQMVPRSYFFTKILIKALTLSMKISYPELDILKVKKEQYDQGCKYYEDLEKKEKKIQKFNPNLKIQQ